ncbi:DUF6783 domain-containing protein [Blautia marasmi]
MEGKYTAKWGVRIVGMNFQTHSGTEWQKFCFCIFYYNDKAGDAMWEIIMRRISVCSRMIWRILC